jgi:hypothetical protein
LDLRVTKFFREFFAKPSSPSFDSEQRTGEASCRRLWWPLAPALRATRSSTKRGKRERRSGGTRRRAHQRLRLREATGIRPTASSPARSPWAAVLWRLNRDGNRQNGHGSARGCLWQSWLALSASTPSESRRGDGRNPGRRRARRLGLAAAARALRRAKRGEAA